MVISQERGKRARLREGHSGSWVFSDSRTSAEVGFNYTKDGLNVEIRVSAIRRGPQSVERRIPQRVRCSVVHPSTEDHQTKELPLADATHVRTHRSRVNEPEAVRCFEPGFFNGEFLEKHGYIIDEQMRMRIEMIF